MWDTGGDTADYTSIFHSFDDNAASKDDEYFYLWKIEILPILHFMIIWATSTKYYINFSYISVLIIVTCRET